METSDLYEEVIKKFDVYHIAIDDEDNCYSKYKDDIKDTWGMFLGNNLKISTLEELPDKIIECIDDSISKANGTYREPINEGNKVQTSSNGAIRW